RQLTEGARFYLLFPANAGLAETERNGDASHPDGAAKTRRRGDTGTRGKDKSPGPRVSASPRRQIVTAHVMSLMQRGFTRLLREGRQIDLGSPDDYQREDFENVYVLVDRLTAREDVRGRLVDSLETCFREGHGQALIQTAEA